MSDIELPQKVLAVLPTDPNTQLDLAHRIAYHAYNQRTISLEQENMRLRDALEQRQSDKKIMDRKLTALELELRELHHKHQAALEEQHKLQADKTALSETVKKLNREVTKLETFKRSLVQHLQDDDGEGSTLRSSLASMDLYESRTAENNVTTFVHHTGGGVGSSSPTGTRYASPGRGPAPGPGSPTGTRYSSPTRSYAPTTSKEPIDGKEFFRQARARLTYEQFNQFLQTIKDLNAGRQSKDATLRKAKELFGFTHSDLYGLFEALLSRHVSGA